MWDVTLQLFDALRGLLGIALAVTLLAFPIGWLYLRAEHRRHFEALSQQGIALDAKATRKALLRTNRARATAKPAVDERSSLRMHQNILGGKR